MPVNVSPARSSSARLHVSSFSATAKLIDDRTLELLNQLVRRRRALVACSVEACSVEASAARRHAAYVVAERFDNAGHILGMK
jgi:hypothetical protein